MSYASGDRFVYAGLYNTRERAEDSLVESYENGDVSNGDKPKIEAIKDHRGRIKGYVITLPI